MRKEGRNITGLWRDSNQRRLDLYSGAVPSELPTTPSTKPFNSAFPHTVVSPAAAIQLRIYMLGTQRHKLYNYITALKKGQFSRHFIKVCLIRRRLAIQSLSVCNYSLAKLPKIQHTKREHSSRTCLHAETPEKVFEKQRFGFRLVPFIRYRIGETRKKAKLKY